MATKPAKHHATYQDVLDAPPHMVAELVGGELYLSPRPAKPHALAASALSGELGPPFHRGRGGPGGWIILHGTEVHLDGDVMVPDLGGWRRERMPSLDPALPYFELAPDWVAEILSPSTRRLDQAQKLPRYAHAGVGWCWVIDPPAKLLVVHELRDGAWSIIETHTGSEPVRARPFDAIELDLGALWDDVAWPEE